MRVDALAAVADQVMHADRALAGKQDAVCGGVGDDVQAIARTRHVQIAARGACATPLRRHRAVHRPEAFLLVAIEIVGARVTGLHAGVDHGMEQHVVVVLRRGHADRAFAAVIIVGADVARLGLAEVRQHVAVAPVFQARPLGPMVEIQCIAADVAHAVDQRRAAQSLAAPAFHASVVHMRLRLGLVGPVVATALQRECQRRRHLCAEIQPIIRPAGFQQQHADARIFGQTRGQHVTCRAGADDDVVVFALHGVLLVAVPV